MRRSHDRAADLELPLAGAPGGVKRKAHAGVYSAPGQIPPMDPGEADVSAEGPLRCSILRGAGSRRIRNAGRKVRGKGAAHAKAAAPSQAQAISERGITPGERESRRPQAFRSAGHSAAQGERARILESDRGAHRFRGEIQAPAPGGILVDVPADFREREGQLIGLEFEIDAAALDVYVP